MLDHISMSAGQLRDLGLALQGSTARLVEALQTLPEGAQLRAVVRALVSDGGGEYLLRAALPQGGQAIPLEFVARSSVALPLGEAVLLELLSLSGDGKAVFRIDGDAGAAPATGPTPMLQGATTPAPATPQGVDLSLLAPGPEIPELFERLNLKPSVENYQILRAIVARNLPVAPPAFEMLRQVLSQVLTRPEDSAAGTTPRASAPSGEAPPQTLTLVSPGLLGALSTLIESGAYFLKEGAPLSAPHVAQLADMASLSEPLGARIADLAARWQRFEGALARLPDPAASTTPRTESPPAPAAAASSPSPSIAGESPPLTPGAPSASAAIEQALVRAHQAFDPGVLRALLQDPGFFEALRDLSRWTEAAARDLVARHPRLALLRAITEELGADPHASKPQAATLPREAPLTARAALESLIQAWEKPGADEDGLRLLARRLMARLDEPQQRLLLRQWARFEESALRDLPEFRELRALAQEGRDVAARAQLFRLFTQVHHQDESRISYYELPLAPGGLLSRATLKIAYRKRARERRDPDLPITVALSVETRALGAIDGVLRAQRRDLLVRLTAAQPQAVAALEKHRERLETALRPLGYRAHVVIERQAPKEARSEPPETTPDAGIDDAPFALDSTFEGWAQKPGALARFDLRV